MKKPLGSQPRGSCRTGPLQASSPGSLPVGRSHWGPTVPRSFLTPSPEPWLALHSAPWDPFLRLLSKIELLKWFPGAGAGWGRWGLQRPLPASALLLPPLLCWGRCLADEPETTSSGGWCLGLSRGKVTLRQLRSCRPWPGPALLTESVSVCLSLSSRSPPLCMSVHADVGWGGCLNSSGSQLLFLCPPPPGLLQRLCDFLCSLALLCLCPFLGVPYPQPLPLTPPSLACAPCSSPSPGLPGPSNWGGAHSASLEGPEPAPIPRNLGNQKLLRNPSGFEPLTLLPAQGCWRERESQVFRSFPRRKRATVVLSQGLGS
ncbi:PREDICTED: uncharacterized protein LOC107545458 [Miniopterus natalensis]|uniref:uncharacterized protein LOC107545458 n=1 Tax=Miniopterus natalensis TaxID=291302 RepID=UPI0007A6EF33|nr:PREDICTED: uncharacterized protein LOC107545458 [Miniopterus natalensis]